MRAPRWRRWSANIGLVRQREALTAPGTLETEARQLGMMKPGEQPYVVTGLPNN